MAVHVAKVPIECFAYDAIRAEDEGQTGSLELNEVHAEHIEAVILWFHHGYYHGPLAQLRNNTTWPATLVEVEYDLEVMRLANQYSISLLYQAAHTKVMACIEPRNVLEIAHELAGSHRFSAFLLVPTLLSHQLLEEYSLLELLETKFSTDSLLCTLLLCFSNQDCVRQTDWR